MTTGSKVAVGIVAGLLLITAWGLRDRLPSGGRAPPSASAKLYPSAATFGCVDRDDLRRAIEIRRQGDAEAAKRFVAAAIVSGRCQPIRAMETVYRDGGDSSDWLKVRRAGEIVGVWVIGPLFTPLP